MRWLGFILSVVIMDGLAPVRRKRCFTGTSPDKR